MVAKTLADNEVFDRLEKLMSHRLKSDIAGDGWEVAQTLMAYTLWQSGWSDDLSLCKESVQTSVTDMANLLADGISEQQSWTDVGAYLMKHDVPSIATQYVTLFTEAGTCVADGVVVRMLIRELENSAAANSRGFVASDLCIDAFSYGYAEKISHLAAKGKYESGNEGNVRRNAYKNARKMAEAEQRYGNLSNPENIVESIQLILDAQQDGMKIKPGEIATTD